MGTRAIISPRRRKAAARRGAAVVEFAMVAPLLFTIVLGIIEFGRGMMVTEMLNNAARAGCRTGTLPGATNSNVTTAVSNSLTGVTGITTTIQVNGSTADVSTANTGDSISVQLSVPYSSVSWLPRNSFLGGVTLSAKAAMPRE